ncbi:PD40 domain-containing protein [candidate division KSB1 bacterium]|nr:PD40 domain-containing protein [candidate division KSB1 bacterium]RQW08628.1 MAG: cytochrome C biosynthesis protein [candidate division KSB1 bacterium]
MKHENKYHRSVVFCLVAVALLVLACSGQYDISDCKSSARPPRLYPDYSDIVIPPNIAPMNFVINEAGEKFVVDIYADSSSVIRLQSKSPRIVIPTRSWRHLLHRSVGRPIYFDIFVYTADEGWTRHQRVVNRVASAPIDHFLVYRFLRPNYTVQEEMTIRQRDLESYRESLIMTTKTISGCINCHSFNQGDPSQMLFHIRWGAAGMIVARQDEICKIDTRTEFNSSPAAYSSWHPNGRLAAFSVNKVFQFFHAADDSRDVIDLASDLILYDCDDNTVSIDAKISSPFYMETFPNWSPDGASLYFCRAPQLRADFDLEEGYRDIQYDLVRIPFEPDSKTWGEPETLVSAAETKLSCSHPRISPDGKYLLFCMVDYGNFPIFHSSADLYLLSLATGEIQRLAVNSDKPEGFHSWSSNSRWIVFTSKRDNGIFTRLYFSHVDESGVVHKPFILPIKEPRHYQTLFKSFSVPELIRRPIPYRAQQFIDAALDEHLERRAQLAPDTEILPRPDIDSTRTVTDFP